MDRRIYFKVAPKKNLFLSFFCPGELSSSNMLSVQSESLGHQIPPQGPIPSEESLSLPLSSFHTFPLLLPSLRPLPGFSLTCVFDSIPLVLLQNKRFSPTPTQKPLILITLATLVLSTPFPLYLLANFFKFS